MNNKQKERVEQTLYLLNRHYDSFFSVAEIAKTTGHPVPIDTRGWSQIIVSTLTGIRGLDRKKGPDLEDGSDVKGANTWEAIDTPRFNGVIKAETQAISSDSLDYLDDTPFLFFVLWDISTLSMYRCRIWIARPQADPEFREMCQLWYSARSEGPIRSTNFQLHPPRGKDTNVIRNTYGNLIYPLLFCAECADKDYELRTFDVESTRISQVSSIFSAARRRFCYKNHEVVAYMEGRIWHTRWVNRNRGAFGSFLTVD